MHDPTISRFCMIFLLPSLRREKRNIDARKIDALQIRGCFHAESASARSPASAPAQVRAGLYDGGRGFQDAAPVTRNPQSRTSRTRPGRLISQDQRLSEGLANRSWIRVMPGPSSGPAPFPVMPGAQIGVAPPRRRQTRSRTAPCSVMPGAEVAAVAPRQALVDAADAGRCRLRTLLTPCIQRGTC